jgi:hypothetical protein
MFSISKIIPAVKWLVIISFVSTIVFWIYDYSKSKERLNHMISENKQINEQIVSIRDVVDKQTKLVTVLRSDYRKIDQLYMKQTEELSRLRLLTNDYLKENNPAVSLDLNSKFKLSQMNIACVSGDNTKCLK